MYHVFNEKTQKNQKKEKEKVTAMNTHHIHKLPNSQTLITSHQALLTFSLYMRQTWMTQLTQAICREGLSSFNPKGFCYSYAWSCSLCEGRTSFCTGLISRKLCGFLFIFSVSFTSFGVLLLFPLSITVFVFLHGF